MNKKLSFLIWFIMFICTWTTYAIVTLSESEVNNAWYSLSNKYTSIWACNTDREKYNKQYSSYIRSDCFSNWGGFKYFICQSWNNCSFDSISSISNSTVVSTSNNSNSYIENIPNKSELDDFLKKVEARKNILSSDKYNELLNQINSKIDILLIKYKNNSEFILWLLILINE